MERRGSWYSYGEERLGQGREKAVEYLTENPAVLEAVESDVRRLIAEKLAGKYGAPRGSRAKLGAGGRHAGAGPGRGARSRDVAYCA